MQIDDHKHELSLFILPTDEHTDINVGRQSPTPERVCQEANGGEPYQSSRLQDSVVWQCHRGWWPDVAEWTQWEQQVIFLRFK